MNRQKQAIFSLLLFGFGVLSLPVFAAAPQAKVVRGFKSLKPIEDLSNLEDPTEVFSNAVRAYRSGNLDEAERLFKKTARLMPKNPEAEFNLGAIAEKRGQLDIAFLHYKKALFIKPTDQDFQAAVNDVAVKIKESQEVLKQNAENEKAQRLVATSKRAKAAFASGSYVEAASNLQQLARLFPNEARLEFALGQSFRALKSYTWAAYHLKMAIYLDPENDTYRKSLVDLDQEVQTAQEQAFNYSAKLAMSHVRPLFGGEVAGVRP